MTKLFLFKSNYAAQLESDAKSGTIDAYRRDAFVFDRDQTYPMMFEVEDDICDRLWSDGEHDFEDAVTLYEALKDVPDVMAADQAFWVSLAHSAFFPYLKKRWGDGDLQTTILSHWFFKNGMVRHGLAGMWWTVRLTVDERLEDKYRLTKVAFWNYSFRTTFMGPSIFFRVQNARTGILQYLADHEGDPEVRNRMENNGRFIAVYFNRLGATRQLAALPVDFFYREMEANRENMLAYNPREKVVEEEDITL